MVVKMDLSVGSNRAMIQKNTLKKSTQNQDEQKNQTQQTAETPKVKVEVQQKTVQLSYPELLANKGIQINQAQPKVANHNNSQTKDVTANVDAETGLRILYQLEAGELELTAEDCIHFIFNGNHVTIRGKEGGGYTCDYYPADVKAKEQAPIEVQLKGNVLNIPIQRLETEKTSTVQNDKPVVKEQHFGFDSLLDFARNYEKFKQFMKPGDAVEIYEETTNTFVIFIVQDDGSLKYSECGG